MSTTELERRVRELLRDRAEEAMAATHPEHRLQELLDDVGDDPRGRRTGAAAALAVAAAAAVLLLVVLGRSGPREEPVPEPAGPTASERVATRYLEAFAEYDEDATQTLLAADGDLMGTTRDWRAQLRWNRAVDFRLLLDECTEESSVGAFTDVHCSVDFHALGSEQLGVGPFRGSYYALTLEDGRVVAVVPHLEIDANGSSAAVWEPFRTWVGQRHPGDLASMYDTAGDAVLSDRSIRLWERNVSDYLAARSAG